MLLLPPANWGEPFNPFTPDSGMELIPIPEPNSPLSPSSSHDCVCITQVQKGKESIL